MAALLCPADGVPGDLVDQRPAPDNDTRTRTAQQFVAPEQHHVDPEGRIEPQGPDDRTGPQGRRVDGRKREDRRFPGEARSHRALATGIAHYEV